MPKRSPKLPKLPLGVLALSIVLAIVLPGQDFTARGTALVDDWSIRHVVFSSPGTFGEALKHGRLAQWSQTISDPRYVMQQARRARGLSAATPGERGIAALSSGLPERPPERPPIHQGPSGGDAETGLWGESLSSSSAATVGAGMYPAKFTFNSNTLNCASASKPDYVVFNTSQAGATGGQATIVAYDNLYKTACSTGSVPTVYWAYNTGAGATAVTSPVISLDGTQVAFVQSTSSVASLVILKFKASEGTPTAAVATGTAPYACTSTTGACSSQAASYVTCKSGSTSCELTLQFSDDGSTAPNDTASPPFYDYQHDIIWVGDNLGYMHKFTNVFNGTPSEAVGSGAGGWPVQATTETTPILNAPVYDSGGSTLLFVTDQTGYLHSVTTTGASSQTVVTSNQMECGTGFRDGPVVDSSNEKVYVFIAYGCDATPGNSYINQFTAGSSFSASYGTYVSFGDANSTTNSTASLAHIGAFDNAYYNGTGTSGNLYVCENGTLFQIPISASLSAINTFNTLVATRSPSDVCSPVSEVYGGAVATTTLSAAITSTTATSVSVASATGIAAGDGIQVDSELMHVSSLTGTTLTVVRGVEGSTAATHSSGATVTDSRDWIFMGLAAGGTATGCSGGCVYGVNVFGATTTGSVTSGLAASGGSSGIVIDNTASTTGGSQVYFTYLSAATASITCPSPSSATTGGCAVQASQSALK